MRFGWKPNPWGGFSLKKYISSIGDSAGPLQSCLCGGALDQSAERYRQSVRDRGVMADGNRRGTDTLFRDCVRGGRSRCADRRIHVGRGGGTAVRRDKAASFQFDWVKPAVDRISEVFAAAEADHAFARALTSRASIEHLRLLAPQGVVLYQKVGKVIEATFPRRSLGRLQVLSVNPATLLPVRSPVDGKRRPHR